MPRYAISVALVAMTLATPLAAQNRVDGQSPDAPALSAYGDLPVGMRRLDLINPGQIDILALNPQATHPAAMPRYDRPLTVEMWYPAAQGTSGETSFQAMIRDGVTQATLTGRAMRDAAAATTDDPYPLVLLSHGYPGNRFLMAHLAENLASKGYVVAAIDHTDSTYGDQGAFASALVNRPLDQVFVLDQMARLNADPASGFAGMIDAGNAGLIGYSMGGYGAIVTAGGGLSDRVMPFAPQDTLAIHRQGSQTHADLPDPRIKTAVAIGPWGMNNGFWDAEGLAGIKVPMLFIAGSADGVSGYENGVRAIWEGAASVDRALLTFDGAGHNAAAPIPAPQESYAAGVSGHYTDAVWDSVFMNNVGQHFLTAWLGAELKQQDSLRAFLDLTPIGSDGIWSLDDQGNPTAQHSYWAGFRNGTANGLRYEVLIATPAPVPLPASAWLLGMAVAGLGALRRRASRRRA